MPSIHGRTSLVAQVDATPVTLQSAAGANGNGTALTLTAEDTEVSVVVQGGGTPVLDVIFEASDDAGSTWVNAFLEDLLAATGIGTQIGTKAVAVTTKLRYRYRPTAGVNAFRARVANFVSGTVTVTATKRTRR